MRRRSNLLVAAATTGMAAPILLAGCDTGPSLPSHVEQRVKEVPPDMVEAVSEPVATPRLDAMPAASRLALQMAMARGPEAETLAETIERALGRIGPAALPSVVPMLRDPNPEMRIVAAEVIARIGPEAAEAVPELIALLADDDEDVRRAAARALGEIGPAAESAVPALLKTLQGTQKDQEV